VLPDLNNDHDTSIGAHAHERRTKWVVAVIAFMMAIELVVGKLTGSMALTADGCVEGACQCVASASVSFRSDVEPILDGACSAAGCHTGVRPREALALDTGKAYSELVNVASSQCGGKRKLVVPGDPFLLDDRLARE
jgi:hypothetical protein